MNSRYMIYCCAGTGGLFLTTVFAQILGYSVKAKFSNTGHAHDMGRGNWQGARSVCFVGDHWTINYRPGHALYYAHQMPDNFIATNPDIELIQIVTDPEDYRKVTELYVKKAWPDIWTEEEYKKWASPAYPPYSPHNIRDSKLIVDDLVNDFELSIVKDWHDRNAGIQPAHTINFKTIMGLDGLAVEQVAADIVKCPANSSVTEYVKHYQQLNKKLYF
jgi:hypothetical protein